MRFAVYWLPEEGSALAEFGRTWFARRLPCTDGARLYGFHATLKPPFRLAAGRSEAELKQALAGFAAATPRFVTAPLRLAELDGFLALRPSAAEAALHALADACVRAIDGFRAPAPAEETARRRQAGLSARQEEMLTAWGYPYLFDQFRFHLTLTDRLNPDQRLEMQAELSGLLAEALAEPVAVRSLALCVQPAPGQPFVTAERFPLGAQ